MSESSYIKLVEKFEEFWFGDHRTENERSDAFTEYVKLIYTPDEAEIIQYLNIQPEIQPSVLQTSTMLPAGKIAEMCGKDIKTVKQILDNAAERSAIVSTGIVADFFSIHGLSRLIRFSKILKKGAGWSGTFKTLFSMGWILAQEGYRNLKTGTFTGLPSPLYALPPIQMFVNLHHVYDHIGPNDKKAANLFQQFFVNDEYYKRYGASSAGTPHVRVIPVKRAIESGQTVLNTEEAHSIIDESESIALVPCPCRTRREKAGDRECRDRNPVGACILLGYSALMLEATGAGKKINSTQAKEYLDAMQNIGLPAITENHTNPVHGIICLCCDCCCSQVRGRTRWDNPAALEPSNFVPQINDNCNYCGICAGRCFFNAISVDKENKRFIISEKQCIGCGICTIACREEALKLHRVDRATTYSSARELFSKIDKENKESLKKTA